MPEKTIEESVHFMCDVNGCDGEVVSTGVSNKTSWGTVYRHKCNKCETPYDFTEYQYPMNVVDHHRATVVRNAPH